MAKAFSEAEKIEIKKKILETALDLFHDKGIKSISIKELTKRAGIAQGSFYSFWQDKDSLIMELVFYRSQQKLKLIEQKFPSSLENPLQFLADIIFVYSTDLMQKIQSQQTYNDAFNVFYKKNNGDINYVKALYVEFLRKLIGYWKDKQVIKNADEDGIASAFIGSFVLCLNAKQFELAYFEDILKIYIINVLKQYIEV